MIEGSYGVVLTPCTPEGDIDYNALERELDFLSKTAIKGFFVCGTTSEFVHLSTEQNIDLLKFASKHLGGKKDLLAGACASNADTSAKYMWHAADLGYTAAVVCPPFYFSRGQGDLLRYYRRLASLNICDIILYNIPMFTTPIERNTFVELLQEKRIIAMKDSSANLKQISHEVDIARRTRPDFSILSGTDDCLVSALMAGCKGSTTAFSVILPEINAVIYKLFEMGRYEEAMAVNQSYLPLLRLADSLMFPTGYKLIFRERGFVMGDSQPNDIETMEKIAPLVRAELKKLLGDDYLVKN